MSDTLTVILWSLFAVVNITAYALMGVDKQRARLHRRRIPEKVLFAFAICFGGIGGAMGMYVFHHKTKHWYFAVFFPLLAILQLGAVVYLKFFVS